MIIHQLQKMILEHGDLIQNLNELSKFVRDYLSSEIRASCHRLPFNYLIEKKAEWTAMKISIICKR